MGGKGSKASVLEKCGALLSADERRHLNASFDAISISPDSESFNESNLKSYLQSIDVAGIDTERLFSALSVSRSSDQSTVTPPTNIVTYSNFILNVSWFVKGSNDQRSKLFHFLLRPPLTVQKVETMLIQFLTLLFSSNKLNSAHFPQLHDWPTSEESLKGVVGLMTESLKVEPESLTRSLDKIEIQIWLMATPLANYVVQSFFSLCFILASSKESPNEDDYSLLPSKIIHPLLKDNFTSLLLDQSAMMFLHNSFPHELRGVAYPLFSSKVHGQSYSTLCRQIIDRGPTLIVIRDTNGFVFGGVANDPWKFNPRFTGGCGSFLFTLRPSYGVYMATGYNENYQYMQQSAQTLPNGLGMGGQIGYFGLWVSADFGTGSSKARPKCSTYGSPCLSSAEEFTIDILEVWGLGQPRLPDDNDEDQPDVSILDVDKEARALLEIAGKPRHSEGLRDEPDD